MTLLAAVMISACGSLKTPPVYDVSIPMLQVQPITGLCEVENQEQVECVLVGKEDFVAIVRELKACCIALGHDDKKCQVEVSDDAKTR